MGEAVRFADMSDDELIQLAKGCHAAVEVYDCFSVSDVHNLHGSLAELERRGYDVNEVSELVIKKLETDEVCCVCGKPSEGDDVCQCVCPQCGEHCYDDVTIADHGECIDCHKARLLQEVLKND